MNLIQNNSNRAFSLRSFYLVAIVLLLSFSGPVQGQLVIPATPTSNSYFQDFNTLPSTGSISWIDNTTIPYWYLKRTGTATSVAADDGTLNAGNAYSYGTTSAPDRALGSVGSGNLLAGSFAWGVQFQNTTTSVVSEFQISFRGEQWRYSGDPNAQRLYCCYKISPTLITDLQPTISTGTWTTVTALNFWAPVLSGAARPLNGNTPPNFSILSSAVPALSLPPSQYLMIKWDDPDWSGNDQGMSTDSVTISWVVCATPVTQASGVIPVTVNQNDITLQWTNGSGSGRFVVMNTVNSFTDPVDGTPFTPANPVYNGTTEQVVYAGTGNTVTVTNLEACRTYYVRVYEYNCSGANVKYSTATGVDNPATVSTSTTNLPAIYNLSGITPYCSGQPLQFNLSGSQLGVNYQLYLDGNPVGSVVPGTGNPMTLSYSPATSGVYTVVATYGTLTYCVSNMNGSVSVTVSPSPSSPSSASVNPDHICGDDAGNILLTASGGSGDSFEWFSGACGTGTLVGTSSSLSIASPTTTTIYYGRWTSPSCGSSACVTDTVFVDAPPTPSFAGNDQGICGSLSDTLAANPVAVGSGLWSVASGPGTITFSNPSSNTSIITASVIGIYNLVWTISNGALCTPSADTVTINFSDAITVTATSNTPVCTGNDLYLYSDIGGATYSWTGPNGFTSIVQNPVINGVSAAAAGIYTVTVSSIPGGCPNTSNTTTVVINNSASSAGSAASNPPSICLGSAGNLILSVPGGSGDTLHWYEGSCNGVHLGTGNNLSVPYPASTTKYFAQWKSNLCGAAPCDSVTVNVVNPPITATAGNQSICGAMSTILTGNIPSPGTGLWTCTAGPGTYAFSNPTAFNSNFSVSAMGTYFLNWTISTGTECPPSVVSITVEFSNNVTVAVSSNSPACEGDTIFLFSSIAGATYAWTGPNGFISAIQNPVITNVIPAQAGSYSVTVSSIPGGCPATTNSVTVAVTGKPLTPAISGLNISGNSQNVCLGAAAPYNYTIGPTAGSTYSWSLSGGGILITLPVSNQADITWNTMGGPFVLSVVETTASGCVGDPVFLNVSVNPPPVIVLPLSTTSATNGQANGRLDVVANGTPPLEYSVDGRPWVSTNQYTDLLPGNHTLQVRDANGCISSEPFTINNNLVGIALDSDTATQCPGMVVSLNVLTSGMVNIMNFDLCLTYDETLVSFDGVQVNTAFWNTITDSGTPGRLLMTWDGSAPVTIPDGSWFFRLDFRGNEPGTSYLQWNDFVPGICGIYNDVGTLFTVSFSEEGAAEFLPRPVADIMGDTTLCAGETLDLIAGDPSIQHRWTLPDGTQFNGQQITLNNVTQAEQGPYYLLTTSSDGCINRDTALVSVHDAPVISLVNGSHLLCADAVYEFRPGEGYASYLWWDGSTIPENSASGEGTYWVVVTDDYGCSGTDTVVLEICPAALYIPSAFTPDGDGLNEVFRARYTDIDVLQNFRMVIYNRWGQVMFETDNIMASWDGYFNGEQCPPGVYTYFINFSKPRGKTFPEDPPFRGMVTLVR